VAGRWTNNLHLMSSSPAINAGSDALIAGQTVDISGDPRISGPHVDLGAYELTRVFVDSRAKGSNNGSSWANAYTDLQSALALKNFDIEIWVARGTYKPTATANRSASFLLASGQMVFAIPGPIRRSSPAILRVTTVPTSPTTATTAIPW
jgi:hypothetical protein